MEAAAVQSWDVPVTGAKRWVVRCLPSLTDIAFLLPLFLVFGVLHGATALLNDGDTGWHLRVGEWILQHRAVPTTDLFSFTKAGQPWFAWEWGWDVLFGAIHAAWGLNGVVLVNVLVLCAVSALLFRLIRRSCGDEALSLVFTIVAICGSTIHWLARPHLLSWVFFLAFAHLLLSAGQGSTRALLWLPLLMVLWANLHGSFFLGIVLVMIGAVAPWIEFILGDGRDWRSAWRHSRAYLACAVCCGAATFLNPYTWRLHEHVIRYLGDSVQMDLIQEFQSISFHHGVAFFEVMLLLGAAAALWCIQRRRWAGALTLVIFAHLSLFAGRNVPMYLLLASPWIACMCIDAPEQLPCLSPSKRAIRSIGEIAREFRPLERIERFHIASLLGVLSVVLLMASGRPDHRLQFDPKKFPATAVSMIEKQHARNILATYQWAGYLIYRQFPKVRVFIDGRSDFYGADFVEQYLHIFGARWDWETDLNRFLVDMVIVEPDSPVSTALKQSPHWRAVLDDGSVIVFVKAPVAEQRSRWPQNFLPVETTEKTSLRSETACKIGTKTNERRCL